LDVFSGWGAGTGVLPTLKFHEIRRFLLVALQNCPAGQWFSTQSLIEYLKTTIATFSSLRNCPHLKINGIPSLPATEIFNEGTDRWLQSDKSIPDDAPDGFERVEGRYVERFLEGIPLIMRFVDVAYDPEPYTGLFPKRGYLKAFRINERFLNLF